jgi:hypothetical protein
MNTKSVNISLRIYECGIESTLLRKNVIVTLNFHSDNPMQQEYIGDVVRLERLGNSKWGVAIRILMPNDPEAWQVASANPVL